MDDNRLIEIMSEILIQAKQTNEYLQRVDQHLVRLEEHTHKTTQLLMQLNACLDRIDVQLQHFAEHENRIRKLEQILKIG